MFTALSVGERYSYNFLGMPPGAGLFLGMVEPIGWLAIEKGDEEIVYLNPALLTSLRPETDPRGQ